MIEDDGTRESGYGRETRGKYLGQIVRRGGRAVGSGRSNRCTINLVLALFLG
jgi:hypothetical protein